MKVSGPLADGQLSILLNLNRVYVTVSSLVSRLDTDAVATAMPIHQTVVASKCQVGVELSD
jgi:hypothetical protein